MCCCCLLVFLPTHLFTCNRNTLTPLLLPSSCVLQLTYPQLLKGKRVPAPRRSPGPGANASPKTVGVCSARPFSLRPLSMQPCTRPHFT
jgi:hypothetical protein